MVDPPSSHIYQVLQHRAQPQSFACGLATGYEPGAEHLLAKQPQQVVGHHPHIEDVLVRLEFARRQPFPPQVGLQFAVELLAGPALFVEPMDHARRPVQVGSIGFDFGGQNFHLQLPVWGGEAVDRPPDDAHRLLCSGDRHLSFSVVGPGAVVHTFPAALGRLPLGFLKPIGRIFFAEVFLYDKIGVVGLLQQLQVVGRILASIGHNQASGRGDLLSSLQDIFQPRLCSVTVAVGFARPQLVVQHKPVQAHVSKYRGVAVKLFVGAGDVFFGRARIVHRGHVNVDDGAVLLEDLLGQLLRMLFQKARREATEGVVGLGWQALNTLPKDLQRRQPAHTQHLREIRVA